MRYQNFHCNKPSVDQIVYFLGPAGKEILGIYKEYPLFFQALDKSVQGYYSKMWRPLTDSEMALVELPVESTIPIKRKYNKRQK